VNTSAQTASTNNYTRRLDNSQELIQTRQQTIPHLTVRWTDSIPALRRFITRFAVNGGLDVTRQQSLTPGETPDEPGDHRSTRIWNYPLQTTLFWTGAGSLVTDFRYAINRRVDSLPGSVTNTNTQEFTSDLQRSFRLPSSWGLIFPIHSHLNWDYQTSSSFVSLVTSPKPSRLSDNGRSAISVSAETPLAPNLKFSLLGSRVITFDNNFDRKFSQYVLTLSFTLEYFAGQLR
jgi:hypothetical protein